jgi:hypothetical protein
MTHPPRWTQPEIDHLEQLAGDVPFPVLLRSMKYKATYEGWPPRTDKAIVLRMRRSHQLGRARTGEWTTTYGAAELLGCPGSRVEAWLRRKPVLQILAPEWTGGTRYMSRRSWRRLAREMPRVLGGFSADVLFALLEDRDLAEAVATAHPRPMGDWRVRCVETGQIFSSCAAAARELHVTQACISLAIRQARPVAALGMTFEALRGAGPSVPSQAAPNESSHGSPLAEDGTTQQGAG